jgi:hypothetical protein
MATTRKGEQMQSQRNVGRMTLVERADALVIRAPLLSRPRAIAAFVMVIVMFATLFLPEFRGPRWNPIGFAIVFAICGSIDVPAAALGITSRDRSPRKPQTDLLNCLRLP